MDWIYLIGALFVIFSVISALLVLLSDCDILTLLYSRFGKQPVEYKDKVVWLTGASSGIGEAIAKELAKVGARLALSARRKEELERVKQECLLISTLQEKDILVLPLDVTNVESHNESFQTVLKHFGKLDVLLSNAGQLQQDEFINMDLKVDRHIFETNVFSIVNMSRIVVKYFMENGGGQLAIVSSLSARAPLPLSSAYTASKHAIQAYFNTLRMETHGRNINMTLICPGPVVSQIFTKVVTNKLEEPESKPLPKGFTFMATERCAYLSLASMANNLSESWVSNSPFILVTYIVVYFPLLFDLSFKLVGWRKVKEVREQRAAHEKQK